VANHNENQDGESRAKPASQRKPAAPTREPDGRRGGVATARARLKPYLVAERGGPTIRSSQPAPEGGSRRKGSGARGA
jgi:hypothetical protein